MGIQGVTRGYGGLQGVTGGYNSNNLIFILRKIHVNMIKCALHESKLSTLISYTK